MSFLSRKYCRHHSRTYSLFVSTHTFFTAIFPSTPSNIHTSIIPTYTYSYTLVRKKVWKEKYENWRLTESNPYVKIPPCHQHNIHSRFECVAIVVFLSLPCIQSHLTTIIWNKTFSIRFLKPLCKPSCTIFNFHLPVVDCNPLTLLTHYCKKNVSFAFTHLYECHVI